MKRVKGSRGWIAAAFTILLTIGSIAVRTKAAIQPSGAAPSTLPGSDTYSTSTSDNRYYVKSAKSVQWIRLGPILGRPGPA
jgi:hypothetical protein